MSSEHNIEVLRLAGFIQVLNTDERRVLGDIAERLVAGRLAYGPLDIAGDQRNWAREAYEERLDLTVYESLMRLSAMSVEALDRHTVPVPWWRRVALRVSAWWRELTKEEGDG